MTTSALRRAPSSRRSRTGFTLLEVIITMSIIAILMGSAFFAFSMDRSTVVVETQGEIEALASNAQRRSVSLGRPHYLIIKKEAIWTTEQLDYNTDFNDLEPSDSIGKIDIPAEITLSCKREDAEWLTMEDRTDPIVWVFSRSGLCERFSFRLEDDKGTSYEFEINPITGNIAEDEATEDK